MRERDHISSLMMEAKYCFQYLDYEEDVTLNSFSFFLFNCLIEAEDFTNKRLSILFRMMGCRDDL